MTEMPWVVFSSIIDHCQHEKYLFKRIKTGADAYRYELWEDGKLLYNKLDYWHCLKWYETVKKPKFGIWI